MRRIAMSVAASTMTLSLAGCGVLNATGSSTTATPTKGNDITVGVLMPDKINTRYTNFDYPIMKSKIAELTNNQGRVDYENAASSAPAQKKQMQKMIDDKVDVIILDAVDAHAIASTVKKAKEAGIPVIAYDRLAEGPIDSYVSFDNELVGEVQARTLLEGLGSNIDSSDKVVMVNGSPTDPNAKQFRTGAVSELTGKVTIAASYDTKDWDPVVAQKEVTKAIDSIGKDNIAAVYSANDAMAGGVVKALKAAGVTNMPPITGQDADLDAIQRILIGEQYMTVYKPYPDEAEAAAEMAVYRVQGKDIQFDALTQDTVDSPTNKDIPSQLVQVNAVTKSKIKDTVVADGIYKISQICTAAYKTACAQAGLK
ncbi:sugar ABC transporter substrate-binding protein [Streptomyces shenzhenensis]|uniref:sugar ABC transporter substrate-binding protein n=1 Tax=Streptomyces shenzhenensis TaxID=943815 RepID=UPI0015F0F8E6|nr:substrate-binding domain-containing protein [Streptomyces shenzhenensis]